MAQIELTAAQTRELQGMEQALTTLRENLERAERAGLDVGDLKQRLADAEAKRAGLLREFSPGAIARRQR